MTHDHEEMLWRSEAIEDVLEIRDTALRSQSTERIGLDRIAGRRVAGPITAEQDIPTHNRATMDGYTFDATEDYPLRIREGEVYPEGDPPSLEAGEAMEIATGASLPPEANAVLKREEAEVVEGSLSGPEIEPGTYTYERGTNVSAGERLFEAGERLTAKDAILLGDLGFDEVEVTDRLHTGVLATGTELHEGRSRDLDSPMLSSLVRSWGHDATYEGTVPDELNAVTGAISNLAERYDVILTTGGTSVGHKDYVVRALQDLGEVQFHRVRIRPGKPLAVATLENAVVFAVPGKPLGAYTITTLVVRPFFTGRTDLPVIRAQLEQNVGLGPEGFEYVIPVTLDGEAATPLGHVDSPLQVYDETFDPSVLSSSTRATRADGFVVTTEGLEADQQIDVVPYPAVE